MKNIEDKSIDMILCDLPYSTTACRWDVIIPFEPLWKQYERIIKDNGAICLFGSEPFSSLLRTSNLKLFKYDWIWNKKKAGNISQSSFRPLKIHEVISVFYKNKSVYNAQKTKLEKPQTRHLGKKSINRTDGSVSLRGQIKYSDSYEPDKKLPTSILDFSKDNYKNNILHPTQKPATLFEYLIKTYTDEDMIILDNAAGSCTTAIASKNLNRRWICIEKEEKYCEISKKRILEIR